MTAEPGPASMRLYTISRVSKAPEAALQAMVLAVVALAVSLLVLRLS